MRSISRRIASTLLAAAPSTALLCGSSPVLAGCPHLGVIQLPGEDRTLFYQLIKACAVDAQERGVDYGSFTIHEARLLALIQRDFDVEAVPSGWDADTGAPVQWEVRVDLADAIGQLRKVLGA